MAGALGAIGAVCIIFAFRAGGLPTYVMPIVFGGAPVINVLTTMALHPPKTRREPAVLRRCADGGGRRGHGALLPASGLKPVTGTRRPYRHRYRYRIPCPYFFPTAHSQPAVRRKSWPSLIATELSV